MNTERYARAIVRNLHEVGAARFERAALNAIARSPTRHEWDFFRVSHNALFNDLISHSIRVLDRNKQSASFWYLHRCNSGAIHKYVRRHRMDWELIENVADKLKVIRDSTHFHIDLEEVMSPSAVWKATGLSGVALARCHTYLWLILQHLHKQQFGDRFDAPTYNGSDVAPIISAAVQAGAIPG